ncbi:hypothetical protein GUJ93_ZPchr0008g11682 [Zizania palustris]|uniref:Uncharacterized protein n=1 Tax=Zizania palustris TaxID=103762 RepID=A0A8J5RI26_ZIZPA|nr:hypothetical protein GUJ93_ZPchr0008g11682 [Zizania palustris]
MTASSWREMGSSELGSSPHLVQADSGGAGRAGPLVACWRPGATGGIGARDEIDYDEAGNEVLSDSDNVLKSLKSTGKK